MRVGPKREKRVFGDRWPTEVWLVDDGDIWWIWCMDCGIKLGNVNAGNEDGAITLTTRHNEAFHRWSA